MINAEKIESIRQELQQDTIELINLASFALAVYFINTVMKDKKDKLLNDKYSRDFMEYIYKVMEIVIVDKDNTKLYIDKLVLILKNPFNFENTEFNECSTFNNVLDESLEKTYNENRIKFLGMLASLELYYMGVDV